MLEDDFFKNQKIQFENLPEHLQCSICGQILNNAYQLNCGCKVCKICIISYLSNGPKCCPYIKCNCKYIITDINDEANIFPDRATDKDISNIPMNCPFNSCPVRLHFKNLVYHIYSCQNREMFCEECQFKMIFNHNNIACVIKIEFCESCDANLKFCKCSDEDNRNINTSLNWPVIDSILEGVELKNETKVQEYLK